MVLKTTCLLFVHEFQTMARQPQQSKAVSSYTDVPYTVLMLFYFEHLMCMSVYSVACSVNCRSVRWTYVNAFNCLHGILFTWNQTQQNALHRIKLEGVDERIGA